MQHRLQQCQQQQQQQQQLQAHQQALAAVAATLNSVNSNQIGNLSLPTTTNNSTICPTSNVAAVVAANMLRAFSGPVGQTTSVTSSSDRLNSVTTNDGLNVSLAQIQTNSSYINSPLNQTNVVSTNAVVNSGLGQVTITNSNQCVMGPVAGASAVSVVPTTQTFSISPTLFCPSAVS